MTLESKSNHSRSASCSSWKIRSQTHLRAQRSKRLHTEFQLPNRSGKSRHGTPVLAIQKTASTKRRLSAVPSSPMYCPQNLVHLLQGRQGDERLQTKNQAPEALWDQAEKDEGLVGATSKKEKGQKMNDEAVEACPPSVGLHALKNRFQAALHGPTGPSWLATARRPAFQRRISFVLSSILDYPNGTHCLRERSDVSGKRLATCE
jgi:hypothetical protein